MTDEELAGIREREANALFGPWHPYATDFRGQTSHSVISKVGSVLAHTGYGPRGGSCHANAEFIAEARSDVPALLAEVNRLRAELADFREMAVSNTKSANEALDRARSECAALTAKAEAIRALPPEPRCNHEGDCSDWSHGWGSGRNATLREVGRILDGRPPLRDYSGMPHTPAQEAAPDLSLIPADLIVSDPEVCSGRPTMRGTRLLASMIAGHLAAGTTWEELAEWYPSMPIPPAEADADGLADAERGTGVREPDTRPQADGGSDA